MGLFEWLSPSLADRRRACREAEAACASLRPGVELIGSTVCAAERSRWVVRVFLGRRPPGTRMPPWNECLIFEVGRGGGPARLLEDDATYRPTLR